MEIYLDKDKTIRLCTDSLNCWIDVKSLNKSTRTDKKNEFVWENKSGYHGSLTSCLKAAVNRELLGSEATTIEELRADLARMESKIDEAIPVLQKVFTDRRRAEFRKKEV